MLYCLDIDGTLIRSFMRNMPCSTCNGERRIRADRLLVGERPLGEDYVSCPECVENYDRVELLPGRAGRLWAVAQSPGTRFALVTNQGGVAFGYQTKEQVGMKLARVAMACAFFYSRPFSVHVSLGHPKATDAEYRDPEQVARRKPSPKMLEEAMAAHSVFADATVYIGDMDTDRECAAAAGVAYMDAGEFFGTMPA